MKVNLFYEKTSVVSIAIEIFQQSKSPMHYKELTSKILGVHGLKGKTPHESVRSLIGTDKRFKRVGEGIYALSEWDEYPVARFAKDIAFEVLQSRSYPIILDDLGEEILKERKFVGSPGAIVRNAIRNDSRFIYNPGTSLVGLTEWGNQFQSE